MFGRKRTQKAALHAGKIEDYALIGDTETAALVGRNGSIDWLCWPTFSSPACFSALLGTSDHGYWKIAPVAPSIDTARRYIPDTLILETTFRTSTGEVILIDFMPPRGDTSDVVRLVRGIRGSVAMRMDLALRFDYGRTVPWVTHTPDGLRAICGQDMAVLRTPAKLKGEGMTTVSEFTIHAGVELAFTLTYASSIGKDGNVPVQDPEVFSPQKALEDTLRYWREWRTRSTYKGPYQDVVHRSLMTLKAMTYKPSGGIVAAATTSLPESIGGERNWDYRYCWLRDTSFTLLILLLAGYEEEATAWRRWLLRAIAGAPSQIQTIYGIRGERQLVEWKADWLPGYENSSPVNIGNAASSQFQLDVFGEVATALAKTPAATDDIRVSAGSVQAQLIDHLCRVWEQPDDGIWETRGGRQHFTHSKVMAWVALDRAIKHHEQYQGSGDIKRWKKNRDLIHKQVCERGFNKSLNAFTQSYGSKELDASCLRIGLVGFLPMNDPRIVGTVDAIQKRLLKNGLVERYDTRRSPDGLPPGEGTFLACSFWMVSNLWLIGRQEQATALYHRLLALRNDVGLLAEEWDTQRNRMVGNFPPGAVAHRDGSFGLCHLRRLAAGGLERCARTAIATSLARPAPNQTFNGTSGKLMRRHQVPVSTYRLQLHKSFTFDDASAVAGYLFELGISHVYSSPYLQAAPESMHGYDVVDHQRVNEELGGADAHERFCKALGENGLGQVLDIVPNHMAIGSQNRFWWDVLENGAASRYASFFDIDWNPQEERLRDKVLVPILGDQYGRVLESGGIKLLRAGPNFFIEAAGEKFPAAPTSLPAILAKAATYANSDAVSFTAASFGRLPTPSLDDRRTVLARHRDKIVITQFLARLCAEQSSVCEAIDRAVEELNADHDALDDFLNQQNYRLAYWKTADQQLGYRRFFDVNNLIGLRMERAHVFEETHALILDWLRRGVLDGVRVDHPDGLRDPLQYFQRLREAAPLAWIIGEKILAAGEFLRKSWPIEGTSGYDFLNVVSGVLVAPEGLARLSNIYGEFSGQPTEFPAIAHDKKMAVVQEALGSDVNRLTTIFVAICESHRNQRDYTRADVRRAIREIAACFAIYRTYVVPERGARSNEITAEDRRFIARAVRCARDNKREIDPGLFDFFEQVLTLQTDGELDSEFVLRFQQFTSPVMAKGVEDTAFYCFNRLTALNEVGADPGRNGLSVEDFHAYQQKMQATHPSTMTTLSTHDTKRADDVRARLAVLSEIPEEFAQAIARWTALNDRHKTKALPDPNSEYFLYQTLIGAWPISPERTKTYMQKAMREAKQQTSWVANNKDFEDALNGFIDAILADSSFTADLESFVGRILLPGRINSLTQTLLKQISPGVPDLYQGSELWDLSLVDPDNRRPVDYELRRKLLGELAALSPAEILHRMDEGLPKLHLIQQSLLLRREHPDWFGPQAAYLPINATGYRSAHVIAFLRGDSVLAVAQRHTVSLGADWQSTTLPIPSGVWRNRLTGETVQGGDVSLEQLLGAFPAALLTREVS